MLSEEETVSSGAQGLHEPFVVDVAVCCVALLITEREKDEVIQQRTPQSQSQEANEINKQSPIALFHRNNPCMPLQQNCV